MRDIWVCERETWVRGSGVGVDLGIFRRGPRSLLLVSTEFRCWTKVDSCQALSLSLWPDSWEGTLDVVVFPRRLVGCLVDTSTDRNPDAPTKRRGHTSSAGHRSSLYRTLVSPRNIPSDHPGRSWTSKWYNPRTYNNRDYYLPACQH